MTTLVVTVTNKFVTPSLLLNLPAGRQGAKTPKEAFYRLSLCCILCPKYTTLQVICQPVGLTLTQPI